MPPSNTLLLGSAALATALLGVRLLEHRVEVFDALMALRSHQRQLAVFRELGWHGLLQLLKQLTSQVVTSDGLIFRKGHPADLFTMQSQLALPASGCKWSGLRHAPREQCIGRASPSQVFCHRTFCSQTRRANKKSPSFSSISLKG